MGKSQVLPICPQQSPAADKSLASRRTSVNWLRASFLEVHQVLGGGFWKTERLKQQSKEKEKREGGRQIRERERKENGRKGGKRMEK